MGYTVGLFPLCDQLCTDRLCHVQVAEVHEGDLELLQDGLSEHLKPAFKVQQFSQKPSEPATT